MPSWLRGGQVRVSISSRCVVDQNDLTTVSSTEPATRFMEPSRPVSQKPMPERPRGVEARRGRGGRPFRGRAGGATPPPAGVAGELGPLAHEKRGESAIDQPSTIWEQAPVTVRQQAGLEAPLAAVADVLPARPGARAERRVCGRSADPARDGARPGPARRRSWPSAPVDLGDPVGQPVVRDRSLGRLPSGPLVVAGPADLELPFPSARALGGAPSTATRNPSAASS